MWEVEVGEKEERGRGGGLKRWSDEECGDESGKDKGRGRGRTKAVCGRSKRERLVQGKGVGKGRTGKEDRKGKVMSDVEGKDEEVE